jgi:hypothetical protein
LTFIRNQPRPTPAAQNYTELPKSERPDARRHCIKQDSVIEAETGHGAALLIDRGKQAEAVVATPSKANRPSNLHRLGRRLFPDNTHMKAGVTTKMIGDEVPTGEIGTGPEGDISPFDFSMLGKKFGESCLPDRLSQ